MVALITSILSLVALILGSWLKYKQTSESITKEAYNAQQAIRDKVISGDVDAVSQSIDGVLSQDNNSPRKQSDSDTAKQLDSILGEGVVSERHSNDKAPDISGS